MIRKQSDFSVTLSTNHKGGKGTIRVLNFLEEEEMRGAGRVFGISIIPAGCSIGQHSHVGDYEVYYILQGKALANDNGTECILEPGDMMWCKEGNFHSIENIGDCDLVYTATILYTQD